MSEKDLILDVSHAPTFEEIIEYIGESVNDLWLEINSFLQREYQSRPKIMYSRCSGKPGWNVKYQKSGKALCTLYPEKDGFVALVVISLDLVRMIGAMSGVFAPGVLETVRSAKPYNGTLWLMIQVREQAVLDSLKELLFLKHGTKRPVVSRIESCKQ